MKFEYDHPQTNGIPNVNHSGFQQLAHHSNPIEKPSRLVRFTARLGITNRNKSMMNAVESAYSFVCGKYEPGDQVILCVTSQAINSDIDLRAAETLAKHLHDGTRPGDRPESQLSSGNKESPRQIPIHGVVVEVSHETREMCKVNDEIKSRFPPGIEHIISYTFIDDGSDQSCATRFDMAGGIVSRELCFSLGGVWDLGIYCTKHLLFWEGYHIPEWDKRDPVWTQELESSPGGAPDDLGLRSTKPVGMYRHELRKYHRLDQWGGDEFMLVWKSYRGADQSHS